MPGALQILEQAIQPHTAIANEEFRWEDLISAMRAVISVPLSSQTEHLLFSVLRFNGHIRLAASSELPHSMAPEDMLKSLAVQALGKWTGSAHVLEMQKVLVTTSSPALASVVRTVIQKARQTVRISGTVLEEIAESKSGPEEDIVESNSEAAFKVESRSLEKDKIVSRPLGNERGWSFVRGRRIRAPHLEPALAY